MKPKILLRDVAGHLGVSIATVSLVLNGKAKEKRISEATAEKVRRYVAQVGYKPNRLAQSFRTGKTHVIALVVEDIANPFFAAVAGLIEKKARARGYRILYCSTNNDAAKTRDLLALFDEQHVDGYILALPNGVAAEVGALVRRGQPVVLFDRLLPGVSANAVVVDGATGTYDATQHLLQQGFRAIALLTLQEEQTQIAGRRHGYAQALREQGRPELVHRVAFRQDPAQLVDELVAFFETHPACDAVLFATNYLGVAGLEALRRLGRRIPGQVAVVCFDDNDLFRLYCPPITVVAQPLEALAEDVIATLLAAMAGPARPARVVQLQLAPQLVVRASSLRPAPDFGKPL